MSTYTAAIQDYPYIIKSRYAAGISSKHSYRVDLQNLHTVICSDVTIINELTRQAYSVHDYIIAKKRK